MFSWREKKNTIYVFMERKRKIQFMFSWREKEKYNLCFHGEKKKNTIYVFMERKRKIQFMFSWREKEKYNLCFHGEKKKNYLSISLKISPYLELWHMQPIKTLISLHNSCQQSMNPKYSDYES